MNIKKIAIATVIAAGFVSGAQAGSLTAADKSITTNLCMTAAAGNRAAMHNKIKASGYSSKFVAKNVQCNGESILAFVDKHGKNSEKMLSILDRSSNEVSITDIAQHTVKEK